MLIGRPERDEFTLGLLHAGASSVAHGFHRVWFAELATSEAFEIFGPGYKGPIVDVERFYASVPEYPVHRYWTGPFDVVDGEDGERKIQANLNRQAAPPTCLQPLDARFSIDYAHRAADPSRNSNLLDLKYMFWRDFAKE
jgi:hypothetical protein